MKVFVAQLNPIIGDLEGNSEKIKEAIALARTAAADLVLFPELVLTGYPPEDFLLLPHFIAEVEEKLKEIALTAKEIHAVVGTVRSENERLYNSAAVISNGHLLGYQDKSLLPTYDVFDEHRYFYPAEELKLWELSGERVAITICEDIWQNAGALKFSKYERDPIQELTGQKVDLLLNLSSSPYHHGKGPLRAEVCQKAAEAVCCPLVMANQVGGNDSLIFDGRSCWVTEDGVQSVAKSFEEDHLLWDTSQHGGASLVEDKMEELHQALVLGLRDYFKKQGFKKACIGLSGGVDSALVAALAAEALGAENVLTIAMPSRYSSDHSMRDAEQLVANLGVRMKVISIEEPFSSYLKLLEPHFEGKPVDTTEENLQARIRGMILMAFSNKHGYIVLSTGNKSEMAMGYATLYGDMAGGLGVINDLLKMQVYDLCRYLNRDQEIIPENIIEKPPSAELRPDQLDSDSLPEYAIVDAVLQGYIVDHFSPKQIAKANGLDLSLVEDLVLKIHRNEYKRRQAPLGLRVSAKSFSVGRRFPIVQRWV